MGVALSLQAQILPSCNIVLLPNPPPLLSPFLALSREEQECPAVTSSSPPTPFFPSLPCPGVLELLFMTVPSPMAVCAGSGILAGQVGGAQGALSCVPQGAWSTASSP